MNKFTLTLLTTFIFIGSSPVFSNLHKSKFRYNDYSLYSLKLPENMQIDSIAVHKQERELLVFSDDQVVKIYRIHLGINPEGSKKISGDFKTPEGLYHITNRNLMSQYHKSLGLSYPNATDILNAKKLGKSPGGDVMIHGLPNRDEFVGMDRYQNDWTWGCIAMRNEEIDELFTAINPGTPIFITP